METFDLGGGRVFQVPTPGVRDPLPNKSVQSQNLDDATVAKLVPAGTILDFAGPTIPTGYLMCDGSQISRTVYTTLFAAISTVWGNGDGSTTFHLPDLRGRVTRGVDGTAGRDPDSSARYASNTGGNTGNAIGSSQDDMYTSHAHTFTQWTQSGQFNGGGPAIGSGTFTSSTAASGGNETRMKNSYTYKIIKY